MIEGKPKKVNESTYSMDMSLAEMLTAMIESTIAADQKAAEDYLRVLRTYALEPAAGPDGHEKLKMVDFEMTDADGQRQIVSIPKLSLLPLPVLRVAEATFDMEAQIEINTSVSEKEQKDFRKRFPLLKQQLQTKIQSTQEGVETDDAEIEQTIAAAGVRVRMLRPGVTPSETQKDVQKMTNVKVHIKLEPVLLPDGTRGLLQATENNIQRVNQAPLKPQPNSPLAMNSNQQKTPGLNCPKCGAFIPTSISELLSASGLRCPQCHLVLTINRHESKRAMEILKNVDEAQQNLKKATSFQR